MNPSYSFSDFIKQYPNDDACLDGIIRLQYPDGVLCKRCNDVTDHYKIKNRPAYACMLCRSHISPLTGTVFEKSTTPLRKWFYTFFLMTQTRSDISIKTLQKELHVTYKTAWRMYKITYVLMQMHEGNLLKATGEKKEQERTGLQKWTFFYKVEYEKE